MNRSSPRPQVRFGCRAVATVEFALTVPILLTLMLGTTDLVLWMRTWMQLQASTSNVAQVISQYQATYTSDFSSVFYSIARAGVPAGLLACPAGSMVVTGVDNTSGTPKVIWQWKSGTCAASGFTRTSGSTTTLTLPGSYSPPKGVPLIVVELFATQANNTFSSGLLRNTGLSAISTYNIVMPRTGSLPTYTAGTRPST